MTPTLIKILIVLIELGVLMGGLKLLERTGRASPELLRKLLHVAMGVTVLSFPWLFDDDWPVLTLASLAAVSLLIVRVLPILSGSVGTVISGVGRTSLGDVYFPVAVGVLWLMSHGDPLMFGVPVLVLTLSDATAALIGVRYGSVHYQTFEGRKSTEGSFSFFVVTFMSVHVPVLLLTDTGRLECLLLAVIIGLLVMLLESVAWRGLDNLLVPLGTYAFMVMYLDAPAEALAWRSVGVVGLVGFTLLWRKRSSMDDSALIYCSLFGYAAILLGNWVWVLPPLMLFITHSTLWPRSKTPPMHSVGAVTAVTGLGMIGLLLHVRYPWHGWLWAYTASFAAHLANVGVSYLLYEKSKSTAARIARLIGSAMLGWGLVFGPIALLSHSDEVTPTGLVIIGLFMLVSTFFSAAMFKGLMPWMYGRPGTPYRVHSTGFALALLAASLNATAVILLTR